MSCDPCDQDTYRRRQVQRSVTRQMSFDLTKLMVTEDWFSDISPQTMRRLLNIVSVTGQTADCRSSVTDESWLSSEQSSDFLFCSCRPSAESQSDQL